MKRYKDKLFSFRVVRFLSVALLNACISFSVINFAFYSLHATKLAASIIATSCIVIFSFAMNRSFVFGERDNPGRKFLPFAIVTVSGLILIQNSIFALSLLIFKNHETVFIRAIKDLTTYKASSNFVDINLGNTIASLLVLIWNYNGYRLFVFKGVKDEIETPDAILKNQ